MLIKFELENFRSFNTKKSFHSVQRNYKRFQNHVHEVNENLGLLKISGVYGGNASGKTNLFRGLYFVKKLVQDPEFLMTDESVKLFYPFRLNEISEKESSKFQVDFVNNEIIYRYKLQVHYIKQSILFENLSRVDENGEEIQIFTRSTNSNDKIEISFENDKDELQRLIFLQDYYTKNPHSALLSTDFLENKNILNAKAWFIDKAKFLFPVYKFMDIAYILSLKEHYIELANRIIKFSNTGIHKLNIDKIPISIYLGSEHNDVINFIKRSLEKKEYHSFRDSNGNECTAIKDKNDNSVHILKLSAIHLDQNGNEVPFDLDQESRGTVVLLHLLPALILTYGEGVNYFIDEINRSLHPILIREILVQYLSNDIGQAKGQLFFNSHEDFMIDETIVRQDEIWLMEKSKSGESDLFPLSDFKNVRHDLNLRKNYLDGKFGGVPFESEPSKLSLNVNL